MEEETGVLPAGEESAELKIGEGKPGPGRPKGSTSKRQVGDLLAIKDVLAAKDYDPIGDLIDLAKAEGASIELRKEVALAVVPYVYSKQPAFLAQADGDEDGGSAAKFTLQVVL